MTRNPFSWDQRKEWARRNWARSLAAELTALNHKTAREEAPGDWRWAGDPKRPPLAPEHRAVGATCPCSWCEAVIDQCPHDCAVGIDAAPIRDSAKVWRCTNCGETINGRKDA